ncbi:MAG: PQQ-dependent dehydrogenase, methanol/ethanol family [Proteobacteria bacterium]|nr:PQQ-dependent dehydrogenase, methanol/ethanol family [Pseudomonadota bacterium]
MVRHFGSEIRHRFAGLACFVLLGLAAAGCRPAAAPPTAAAGRVDATRLAAAGQEPENWFTAGRDQDGTYYSPLKLIDAGNVARLGFAWEYDLGTPRRGQEATPIVVDGTMYTSGTWGYVYALDAATGAERWRYDPHAAPAAARNPCCDLVNRGVAVWKGRVYVAAVDGRLHAVDAASGRKLWDVDTIVDHALPYSSTGAPQIAGAVVVIGNSGSDMGRRGVRGYVSAYDLETGALRWRFYTVPPAPGKPLEHPELEAAAKTWDPKRGADYQGGGTAWDAFAYDPALDLVYFGTANAAPYDLRELGPSRLDSLYTASILAVNATTGRLAWYYQTTPHDHWDYDAVQKLVFAQLTIDGQPRAVLMQASKNGFFYVLDRRSGELLSAEPYTYVTWASGVDRKTGRPILNPKGEWYTGLKNVYPSWAGGHTWNPMSYSPATHLVYIPALDVPNLWVNLKSSGGAVKYLDGYFTANGIIPDDAYDAAGLKELFGPLPERKALERERPGKLVRELLRAWDPVAHKVVWEQETSAGIRGYDGGVLSTAGNLVFQGRGSGELWVYAADTGAVLKKIQTGSHIMAAPMTYAVGGVQYVAVQVGYGGAAMTAGPVPPSSAAATYENKNRILAFRLDGGAVPTPAKLEPVVFEEPPHQDVKPARLHRGEVLFVQECSRCHTFGISVTPDLRRLTTAQHSVFNDIVLRGAVAPTGMEKFDDILSEQDADDIHAYLIDEAWKAYRAQQAERARAGHP